MYQTYKFQLLFGDLRLPEQCIYIIHRLNDISVCMVNDTGEAMKISSKVFAEFIQIEARQNMSWAKYCTSIKDQAKQFAYISLFGDKLEKIAEKQLEYGILPYLRGKESARKKKRETGRGYL